MRTIRPLLFLLLVVFTYVASLDFPYLVGCYKGTPITQATGLGIGPQR
jgi:hypothetical protein